MGQHQTHLIFYDYDTAQILWTEMMEAALSLGIVPEASAKVTKIIAIAGPI